MKRMMIDIETLDTRPTAVVLSVGLVVFSQDRWRAYQEHLTSYHTLELQGQVDIGRTISESTLMWWMNQSSEARGAAFGETDRISPEQFGTRLRTLYEDCEEVWSHGAGFDITILESLLGEGVPWGHREARDTRTLSAITGIPVSKPQQAADEHHALNDARAQAVWVTTALRTL